MLFSLINHHDFKSLERIFVVIFESNDPKQGNEKKNLVKLPQTCNFRSGQINQTSGDNLLKHYRNEWVHNAFMAFRGDEQSGPLGNKWPHERESQMDHQGSRTKKKRTTQH